MSVEEDLAGWMEDLDDEAATAIVAAFRFSVRDKTLGTTVSPRTDATAPRPNPMRAVIL